MRESGYGGTLANKVEKMIGGQVRKIADSASLGLPDNMHIHHGRITFWETKMIEYKDVTKETGKYMVQPWHVVNDLRQFEICRLMSKHAMVLYAAYCPELQMSWVLEVNMLNDYRRGSYIEEGMFFKKGHGVDIINYWEEHQVWNQM